jgi:phosphoribosylformylglycinamidine synthase PurS subunit
MSRVRIEIRYLPGVEDPEALTIRKNLSTLGYESVKSVSTVKIFELEISGGKSDSLAMAKELAEKLLINPVIHQYKISEISD